MENLLAKIKTHFDILDDRLKCFSALGVQVEGWFKGELLFLLSKLKNEGLINAYDREIKIKRGKIDLSINKNGSHHYIELKHWLCGYQRSNYLFTPSFYFPDHTSVGIIKDVNKLISSRKRGDKWLLILVAKNPGDDNWQKGLCAFHQKFSNRKLISLSTPNDFSDSYFLGLLKIKKP
jgi:hypothetical protein